MMDALSEALNTVSMSSAIFFNAEFTAPWGFSAPHTSKLAPVLAPGTGHLVVYHLVTDGTAIVRIPGTDDLSLAPGDIVIIPHGDAHVVSNGTPSTVIDGVSSLGQHLSSDLSLMRYGGGGDATCFVCGFFGCDRRAGQLFLTGLLPMIKINIRGDAAGEWLETSIRHLVAEAGSARPGRTVLLSKMADVLFIEALRRYMEQMPPEQTGWLAGARDSVVGAALALLHRRPCHPWTISKLAAESGASRSGLAERFTRFLGEPPLTYLTRWRLLLAARKLQTSRNTVVQVAFEVGYESESAFNRAFKREFGVPPAQYRRTLTGRGIV
jgi:AraC-like DNA-binding protein